MELSFKYQYTYFLHPYIIESGKYEKYILRLLKDKKSTLKIFEKEKDLDIYNYFSPNIRENLFPTFELRDERLRNFKELNNEKKAKILAKDSCVCFEYLLGETVQGKVGRENGIFFNIPKIDIVCFNTGICFLSIKTIIEESEKFSDVLNFNYKFKEINSEFASLKQYENINIQTDILKDVTEISDIIKDITGTQRNDTSLENKFYTFGYTCIPYECWNDKNGFENFDNEFLKYVNTFPSNYITDLNRQSEEQNLSTISKLKYSRTGITKSNCNLLCSAVDMYNYTKLPYEYETVIYYTYILRLYQKIFLKNINNQFKSYDKIIHIRKNFIDFTKTLWAKEITNDDTGSLYYRMLGNTFELDEQFEQIRKKYEIIYKDLDIEKNNRNYSIMVMLLILSLILNTFTIIAYMFM
ncbi:MAG: hypothetical protein HFJ25_03055 [Clostridia bacterium]|nr:hypothetical protein [Clostridia bacterium]